MMDRTVRTVLKHTDLLAAVGVVMVVTMLVIPLPSMLLDLMITLNISGALAIVVATMYINKALEFSAFPTLLLLTTMFRLAINVSVTRLVLTTGDAGSVVRDFGQFVVGGNVVIGLVIFLILVVIQFVVVTNGAGRVAEVSARFTLDAMPGKQMAIDADLNAGLITDEQARARRAEIAREADFYGAMDGASKFVKGDAMAAVVITAINLIGGIVVGVLQHHEGFSAATHHYSLLDRRRRSGRPDPGAADLGRDRHHRHPLRAPRATSAPSWPRRSSASARRRWWPAARSSPSRSCRDCRRSRSCSSAGSCSRSAGRCARTASRRSPPSPPPPRCRPPPRPSRRCAPRDEVMKELPIDPLELGIGFGLVPLVDRGSGGSLVRRISLIRRQIAGELGMVIPPVRIHDEVDLDSHEYVCKVRGTEVARGRVMAGHKLAMDPGDAVGNLSGIPTTEPAFGLPAVWIADAQHSEAEALGYTVVDAESVIVTHLTETIRSHAAQPAHPPGRPPAARPAQGVQRGRGQRGGAGHPVAGRDPARPANLVVRGGLDQGSGRYRRSSGRQGADHA